MKHLRKRGRINRANLYRGDRQEVTTFLSAFGRNKEVNLTAYLAYIIHLHPAFANSLFGINGTVQEVLRSKLDLE